MFSLALLHSCLLCRGLRFASSPPPHTLPSHPFPPSPPSAPPGSPPPHSPTHPHTHSDGLLRDLASRKHLLALWVVDSEEELRRALLLKATDVLISNRPLYILRLLGRDATGASGGVAGVDTGVTTSWDDVRAPLQQAAAEVTSEEDARVTIE